VALGRREPEIIEPTVDQQQSRLRQQGSHQREPPRDRVIERRAIGMDAGGEAFGQGRRQLAQAHAIEQPVELLADVRSRVTVEVVEDAAADQLRSTHQRNVIAQALGLDLV
jgi:hypothetical protein